MELRNIFVKNIHRPENRRKFIETLREIKGKSLNRLKVSLVKSRLNLDQYQ